MPVFRLGVDEGPQKNASKKQTARKKKKITKKSQLLYRMSSNY